jgi:tRNA (cmo5U34)-methyltransferase
MPHEPHRPSVASAFDREVAIRYDERNSKLTAITENMHFLIRLALADLPQHARILCVGAGTGAEILSLAEEREDWTFVGVDPSVEMLDVCRERLQRAGVGGRCDLVAGYVNQVPKGSGFDAVLSILVAHFVQREDMGGFYRSIHDRLKPGGYYISAEISFDLDAPGYPEMLANWARVQSLMGATADSLQKLPDTLRNMLAVVSPAETEELLVAAGFERTVQFFQAFLIRGYLGKK